MVSIIYKGFIVQGSSMNGDLTGKINKIDRGDTRGFVSATVNASGNGLPEWDEATNDEILAEIHKMNDQVKMLDIGVTILTWMGFLAFVAAIIK